MNSSFLLLFLGILPRNLLSRATGWLVSRRWGAFSFWIRDCLIRAFSVDVEEAEKALQEYPSWQDFFTRRLRPGSRIIADSPVVSPVDGHLVHCGELQGENLELTQVKGRQYTLARLLRDPQLANEFRGGSWTTIYLAPFNYHRIHSPVDGYVRSVRYIPGTLWPVNRGSVQHIDELFCVNERIITELVTPDGARCLVVKVGATNVGKISLAFSDHILSNTASAKQAPLFWESEQNIHLDKGEELGCFEMGSTVVLVFDSLWKSIAPELFFRAGERDVRMGEAL